jgi:hypothetical protein
VRGEFCAGFVVEGDLVSRCGVEGEAGEGVGVLLGGFRV